MIERRDLELVDEDLRVLRRAAADDDAGAAERQRIARDTGHHLQRAHDVVAGAGQALQLLARELRGALRGRRDLTLDLDRLGDRGLREQHDVVGLTRGREAGAKAVLDDDEARTFGRIRDRERAVRIRRDSLLRSFDRDRGAANGLALRVDDAASDRRCHGGPHAEQQYGNDHPQDTHSSGACE